MKAHQDRDILSGLQWEQVKGKAKEWWNKLTDEDLERIHGHNNILIDVIAERYGYTKEQADREVSKFMEQFRANQR